MIVKQLSKEGYVPIGTIRYEDGVVNLSFGDERIESHFSVVAFGDRSFSAADGLAYLDALIAVFWGSKPIQLLWEEGDAPWLRPDGNIIRNDNPHDTQ